MIKLLGLISLIFTLNSYSVLARPASNKFENILEAKKLPDNRTSLFDHLYQIKGRPQIELDTDLKLLRKNKYKETYQKTVLKILDADAEPILETRAKLRARGNMRKKVSYLPPLKIDLKKSILDSLGFLKLDDLKLVLPASQSKANQEKLFQEFLLYKLYQILDNNAIRVKLVDIRISHHGKEKYRVTGFLIEDDEEYEHRQYASIIKKGKIINAALDERTFAKVVLFQYMIGNTDFSIEDRHNVEVVKLPNEKALFLIPFDFDYSGFVNQAYAIPHPDLPIESVRERYFYSGYKVEEEMFETMVDYFCELEEEIMKYCETVPYLSEKTIAINRRYLGDFFEQLKSSKSLKLSVVK